MGSDHLIQGPESSSRVRIYTHCSSSLLPHCVFADLQIHHGGADQHWWGNSHWFSFTQSAADGRRLEDKKERRQKQKRQEWHDIFWKNGYRYLSYCEGKKLDSKRQIYIYSQLWTHIPMHIKFRYYTHMKYDMKAEGRLWGRRGLSGHCKNK